MGFFLLSNGFIKVWNIFVRRLDREVESSLCKSVYCERQKYSFDCL